MASNRAEAIKKAQSANTAKSKPEEVVETQEVEVDFSGVEAKDFGGTVRVGVLFDAYPLNVEGTWKTARKGEVIKVKSEVADRGEKIGGLARI